MSSRFLCLLVGVALVTPLFAADAPPPAKELLPRYVKLQGSDIPLSQALKELAKQTGNEVQDRREERKELKLKLNLEKATFWQTLDAIAREADLRVSLYSEDRSVALVDGPYRELPVSYDGLFRVTVKKVTAVHDLQADDKLARYTLATLEVAWEPRFQAFMLEDQPTDLVLKDDKGRGRDVLVKGKGKAFVGGKLAEEVVVFLPAIPRSSAKIGLLQGKLSVVGSARMLEFAFTNLDRFNPKKGDPHTIDGVSVTLNRVSDNGDTWTFGLSLVYPAGGPQPESFESSLLNNEIYLEKAGKRFAHNAGESLDQAGNRAQVSYHFEDDKTKNFTRGKLAGWTLVYLTPSQLVEVPIKFEFKDVELP
jgi:hypothetical protein